MARGVSDWRGGPTAEQREGAGMGTADAIALRSARRCGRHVRPSDTSRRTPPVTAFTDGAGKGGVASAGLADGQLFMGCQPADMRYRRGDASSPVLLGLLPLSGRHGAELNRAARAGQLRLDSCERDARGSMHARCWDALDCIWYARLLERCHRPSGAHPSREGRRWRRCDACGSRWYRAKSCQSRSEPPGPRFSSQVATERPRGVF